MSVFGVFRRCRMKKLIGFVLLVTVVKPGVSEYLKKLQNNHKTRELTNSDLRVLANLSDKSHIDEVLDNILIPRVVGTPGHQRVFNYIKNDLESLNWSVEVDEFEEKTPNFGVLTFKNIVARLNPNADRYLTLACHYDSKYFANEVFVGATDSAVPCAMLLNIARTMRKQLDAVKANQDVSLQLIFFDGEEAFVNWGPKDSIYGARHLVQKFHKAQKQHQKSGEIITDLQKIDMLVLLDLIGHSDVNFYSFFPNTEKWYVQLTNLEDRLRKLRLLKETQKSVYFNKAAHYGRIEDDHIPFMNRGVPILHLISTPFPNEWHTTDDNRDIVDMATTENITKILMAFVAEYLNIDLDREQRPKKPDKEL